MENYERDDELLIKNVEKFDIIYNKNNSLFKDKLERRNAWETIAMCLGKTVEECESRWHVLRTRYSVELNKIKHATASGSEAYSGCKWYAFEWMGFLMEHIRPRRTKGNINLKFSASPLPSRTADTKSSPLPSTPTLNTLGYIIKLQDNRKNGHNNFQAAVNNTKTAFNETIIKTLPVPITETRDSNQLFTQMIGLDISQIKDPKILSELKLKIMTVVSEALAKDRDSGVKTKD